jgi:tRNA-dihydrouridine synthase B
MTSRLILAPLRGVTTLTYRTVFATHFGGLDVAMAPFIPTVNAARIKPSLLRDVDPQLNAAAMPVIPQIIGRNPADMARLCNTLFDLGYPVTNWNLGCPWPHVARKHRGSGLLPYPDEIDAILDACLPQLRGQLSVKVRLGYREPTELLAVAPVLNRYPLDEVTVHARTGVQMYTGKPDLDAFAAAASVLTAPLVYNGDITTATGLAELVARFPGIDRWMIGRGICINPLLACQIRGEVVTPEAFCERLRAFHDELRERYAEELYGVAPLLGRLKELWKYMALAFGKSDRFLYELLRVRKIEHYDLLVARFFDAAPQPVDPAG